MNIERLLFSKEYRFDFVNGVTAMAKEYVEKYRDDYCDFFHVLNYGMNDAHIYDIWSRRVFNRRLFQARC